jgi:hypothetical protein
MGKKSFPVINFMGTTDLGELYRLLRQFYADNEFDVFDEKKYKHKIKSSGHELEVKFTGFKEISNYIKLTVDVELKVFGSKNVSMKDVNGHDVVRDNADLYVKVSYNFENDYDEFFKKGTWVDILKKFYEKNVGAKDLKEYTKTYEDILKDYIKAIKKFLNLESEL